VPLVKPVADDDSNPEYSENNLYFGSRDPTLAGTRMCMPTRLADCITHATDILHRLDKVSDAANFQDKLYCKIQQVYCGRPPSDVRDAVRALFVREIVDVREAFLGFADFLLWCRFPYDITPLDPVVCAYGTNFPCEADDSDDSESDDDDDDSDDESSASGEACVMNWCADEDGHVLTRGEIRARFDFSLLLLFRAWNMPWKPSSHLSYQPQFRQAAKCIMLCTHRRAMPKDVGLRIVEFLGRDFWPDDRTQCWSFDCPESIENVTKRITGSHHATTNIKSAIPCSTCKIAMYCCKACMKKDWKDDHKRFCGAPPFRRLGPDEERFIAKVLGEETDVRVEEVALLLMKTSNDDQLKVDENEAEENDDEEWSDIGSDVDEEYETSRTRMIYRYFEERSYTPRGIDD
jgi:hypothetical protein